MKNMNTIIAGFGFLAIMIESIVEGITGTENFPSKYNNGLVKRIMSVILGLLFVFGFGIDYSSVLGFTPVYEWVGLVFTGVVAGLGSGLVHDLFKNIR